VPGVKAGVSAGMHGKSNSTPTPLRSNKADVTTAVVWVPDDNLRALFPDEDHGAAHVISSLEEWKSEEWGLPALSVSRFERDESEETRRSRKRPRKGPRMRPGPRPRRHTPDYECRGMVRSDRPYRCRGDAESRQRRLGHASG
jgi:hypothetical protein